MKTQATIIGIMALAITLFTISACNDNSKENNGNTEESTSKTKSSLQILGFDDNVAVEDDNEPITLYLEYGFNKHKKLQINRLSKEDYDNVAPVNPIESMVGQFGLFTMGYAMNHNDLIKQNSIKYEALLFFNNQPVNIPNYGEAAQLENENGQQIMEIHRDLKLFEFINDMHERGKEEFGSDFYSLNELKENPKIIHSSPTITLRLNLIFEYETKSGNTGENEIKLFLRPAELSTEHNS